MSFEHLPTLEGELVKLAPALPRDFEALYQVAKDPQIWEQHPQRHRYQGEQFKKFFDDGVNGTGMLLIYDKNANELIGSSRFYDYSSEKKWVAIGYTFLACAYWGGRYNWDLKRTMIRHAFQNPQIEKIVFHVGEANTRSRKAVGKIGAELFDRDERTMPDGTVSIRMWYGLDRKTAQDFKLA